jgi:hypothetical protein
MQDACLIEATSAKKTTAFMFNAQTLCFPDNHLVNNLMHIRTFHINCSEGAELKFKT